MKLFANLKLVALFALFAAIPFAAGVYTERAAAEGTGTVKAQEQAPAPQQQQQQKAPAEVTYEYTAQPGDSYSQIARKAVQTYGLNKKVNLSQAQIIFAETNLTQAARSPFLNEGQKVTIKESLVKDWVEKAEKLTAAQKAAWQAYTVGVDFNTDKVGQAK